VPESDDMGLLAEEDKPFFAEAKVKAKQLKKKKKKKKKNE